LQLICLIVIWGLGCIGAASFFISTFWKVLISHKLTVQDYFAIIKNLLDYSKHLLLLWIISSKQNEIRKLLEAAGSYTSYYALERDAKKPTSAKVKCVSYDMKENVKLSTLLFCLKN